MPHPTSPAESAFWRDLAEHLIPHHGIGASHLAARLADRYLDNPATREKCLDRVAMLLGRQPGEVGGVDSEEEQHAVPRRRRSA